MCILSPVQPLASRAATLAGSARQQLALDALAGLPISHIAQDQHVSRKFVYQQLHQAHDALDHAFAPPPCDPPQLLFWLPVTKPWLRQLVLGLVLICHSSLRGVTELLADLFDHPLSLGTVHNILHQAVASRTPGQRRAGPRRRPHRRPRRDLPGRPARPGRRRRRFDLLLPAQPRRAPRRRHLGRAPAGTARPGLPPRRHHRRFRRRLAGRPGRGLARRSLSRRRLPRLADGHCRWSATWRTAPTRPSPPAAAWNSRQARTEHRQGRKDRVAGRATAVRPRGRDPGHRPWPTRWPCCSAGCVRTSWRWPAPTTPAAARCTTGSWRSCRQREPRARTGSGRSACLLENQRDDLLAFAEATGPGPCGVGGGLRGARDAGRGGPPGAEPVERVGPERGSASRRCGSALGRALRGGAGGGGRRCWGRWCGPAA